MAAKPDTPKSITITIDGDDHVVEKEEMTARALLELAGLDPSTSYLILLHGEGKQESYRDRLDEEIKLHNKMQFVSGDLGPAPVA
jgi:hypothetical protein